MQSSPKFFNARFCTRTVESGCVGSDAWAGGCGDGGGRGGSGDGTSDQVPCKALVSIDTTSAITADGRTFVTPSRSNSRLCNF